MRMMRAWSAAMLIASAPAAMAGDKSGEYAVGTLYHDSVALPNFTVPLPEGAWKLTTSRDATNDTGMHFLVLYFFNTTPLNNPNRTLFISVNVDLPLRGRLGWTTPAECFRKDLYKVVLASDMPNDQACWWVTHLVFKPETKAPPVLIQQGIHLANQNNSIFYVVTVDPAAGLRPSQYSSWAESPFHKDKLATDPARASYMEEQAKQTEKLYQFLREKFF